MKKLLLASAIAALSVSAAQAAPTVYGKAFLTVDAVDGDVFESESTQLNNNASRIGFKGSEPLTANTDVIYQLEYGVTVDDNSDQFTARDTYLGLSNKDMGTIMAGRLTAIDDNVDFANVLEGTNVAEEAGYAFDEPRANNTFAYASPNFDGMQFYAMYSLADDSKDTSDDDAYGIAAKYSTGPVNLGASYIAINDDESAARISGSYDVSPAFTVGALYQMTDKNTDDNENAITVSGTMKTATPWSYYAQVNMIDNAGGSKDAEKLGVGVGGKYAFNKAATGHLYAGYYEEDNGKSVDGFGLGGGLEYKF